LGVNYRQRINGVGVAITSASATPGTASLRQAAMNQSRNFTSLLNPSYLQNAQQQQQQNATSAAAVAAAAAAAAVSAAIANGTQTNMNTPSAVTQNRKREAEGERLCSTFLSLQSNLHVCFASYILSSLFLSSMIVLFSIKFLVKIIMFLMFLVKIIRILMQCVNLFVILIINFELHK